MKVKLTRSDIGKRVKMKRTDTEGGSKLEKEERVKLPWRDIG